MDLSETSSAGPALVAIAGWLVPGGGYLLQGQRQRGVVVLVAILALYLSGILIAGVRVVDVPGYDRNGYDVRIDPRGRRVEKGDRFYEQGTSALFSSYFISEIAAKPWYVGQVLAGPLNLLASWASVAVARQGTPMTHARIGEIGTLYTAVAGMLNLLTIIDAAHRAAAPEAYEPDDEPAAEAAS